MIDLMLAILTSAMIPVLLKYAHQRDSADEVILTFNYVAALGISVAFSVLFSEVQGVGIEPQLLSLLIPLGILTGLAYYGAFFFYQKSVRENGVSISIAVGKMGILIPILLSLLLWRDMPSMIQWVGISVSLVAIGLINLHPTDFRGTRIKTSLLLFFIIGGLGDFFNKFFEVSVGEASKSLFLAVVFASAFVASLYWTLKKGAITWKSVGWGFLVGVPNMLTAYFLISALSQINAAVVFPMYSGGAIVCSMMWSAFAFGERMKLREAMGVGMILLALVLINL